MAVGKGAAARHRRLTGTSKARTARKIRTLLKRDGSVCWLCGEEMRDDVTLDHVIPRSKGGSDANANLRLAHRACNGARGNADPAA